MNRAECTTLKLPKKLRSDWQRYKEHGRHITRWLIQEAQELSSLGPAPPNSEYDLHIRQYVSLSNEIVRKRRNPPGDLFARLNTIIRLRSRCCQWYQENAPLDTRGNEGHLHFISQMRRVRKIWFGIPLEYDTEDSDKDAAADRIRVVVSSFAISIREYTGSSSGDEEDEDDEELDEDTLSDLPLSAFRFTPWANVFDESDDVDSEAESEARSDGEEEDIEDFSTDDTYEVESRMSVLIHRGCTPENAKDIANLVSRHFQSLPDSSNKAQLQQHTRLLIREWEVPDGNRIPRSLISDALFSLLVGCVLQATARNGERLDFDYPAHIIRLCQEAAHHPTFVATRKIWHNLEQYAKQHPRGFL
ncbi:hypothetical protein C8J57DRAFT_1384036 [Mycena rebaudengoi]|nr:hypothetical protein C8J57DRAFT_1384036 [Mycena rebaudengoi]